MYALERLLVSGSTELPECRCGRKMRIASIEPRLERSDTHRCLVQLEGGIVRRPIELLQSEFERSEYVRDLFVSYSKTLLSQVQ
jgi:hypothetical protein